MIYAKQIDPEDQESPLFMDYVFLESVVVCGNRDYKERTTDVFERVKRALESCDIPYEIEKVTDYKNATEVINDMLPPEKTRKKYSTKDIHKLKELVSEYSTCNRRDENALLCKVMSIVTGKKWDYKTIRGTCQSDWNYIYYPVDEWDDEGLNNFETEYFNTGSEWIVDDEDYNPKESKPLDISGYCIYCHSWDNDGIRKEIADSAGVKPEEVVLYGFTGYTRIPQYEEMA